MKKEWNTTQVFSRTFPSIDVLSFFLNKNVFLSLLVREKSPDLNNYQYLQPQIYTSNLRPKADC